MKTEKEYTLADAIRDGIIPIPSYASNPQPIIVPKGTSEKQSVELFTIQSTPTDEPNIVVYGKALSSETSNKKPVIFDIVDNSRKNDKTDRALTKLAELLEDELAVCEHNAQSISTTEIEQAFNQGCRESFNVALKLIEKIQNGTCKID